MSPARSARVERVGEARGDAVGGQHEDVPPLERQRRRPQWRKRVARHAGERQQGLRAPWAGRAHEPALDVADAEPGQGGRVAVDAGDAHGGPARAPRAPRGSGSPPRRPTTTPSSSTAARPRRRPRPRPAPWPSPSITTASACGSSTRIDARGRPRRSRRAPGSTRTPTRAAGALIGPAVSRSRSSSSRARHLAMRTVVPRPAAVSMSKSSMIRRDAGQAQPEARPGPDALLQRRVDVADAGPAVGGDDEDAAAAVDLRGPQARSRRCRRARGCCARSPRSRWRSASRPCARTRAARRASGPRRARGRRPRRWLSAAGSRHPRRPLTLPDPAVQHREALLEVERGVQRREVELELDHRDGDVGLDADDHRLGPAQPRRQRDRAQRPRDERVDDVERGDVDDDPERPVAPHALHEVVAQLDARPCRSAPTGSWRSGTAPA